MNATFTKTFTRANTNINWPPQVRAVDDYVASTYPECLSWRVSSFSDDLSFTYTSTWSSIEELEAALEDEVILNNVDEMDVYCISNSITTTYSIY
jgi:hypothetical protein